MINSASSFLDHESQQLYVKLEKKVAKEKKKDPQSVYLSVIEPAMEKFRCKLLKSQYANTKDFEEQVHYVVSALATDLLMVETEKSK